MKHVKVCLFAVLLIAQTGLTQRTLLQESFNDNHNNWGLYPNSRPAYAIYNGKYIMDVADSGTYNSAIAVGLDTAKNYSISLVAVHTSGADTYSYGMVFGEADYNNFYCFTISGNGYFSLGKFTAGNYSDIVKWTTSPALKTGSYVENKLRIAKDGRSWKMFLNDQLVSTVDAQPFMGNKIGCEVSRPQRIEFDDIVVAQ